MSPDDKWKQHKLENLKRLNGLTFHLTDYTAPSADWDHDHFEGCHGKFAEFDEPQILHRGYFTILAKRKTVNEEPEFINKAREGGQRVLAKPDDRVWICQKCFQTYGEALHWKITLPVKGRRKN